MVTQTETLERRVWDVLETIEDPELPVAITDLGLIREVAVDGGRIHVTMVPTFSACPAIGVMREDRSHGGGVSFLWFDQHPPGKPVRTHIVPGHLLLPGLQEPHRAVPTAGGSKRGGGRP